MPSDLLLIKLSRKKPVPRSYQHRNQSPLALYLQRKLKLRRRKLPSRMATKMVKAILLYRMLHQQLLS